LSSGIWASEKIIVSPMMPNTLKLTQKSVDWVRHTISLSTAIARKNSAKRSVSLRHPGLVHVPGGADYGLRSGLPWLIPAVRLV
jgi:hypothetical protein